MLLCTVLLVPCEGQRASPPPVELANAPARRLPGTPAPSRAPQRGCPDAPLSTARTCHRPQKHGSRRWIHRPCPCGFDSPPLPVDSTHPPCLWIRLTPPACGFDSPPLPMDSTHPPLPADSTHPPCLRTHP
eukprot:1179749-Prorocentrum_minimum.AAC.4